MSEPTTLGAVRSEHNIVHQFEVDLAVFRSVALGQQTALVASRESDVREGDQLVLHEVRRLDSGRTLGTGQWSCRRVTHILAGGESTGIDEGFVVLCFNTALENEYATAYLKKRLNAAERQGIAPVRFWQHEQMSEQEKRRVTRALEAARSESALRHRGARP